MKFLTLKFLILTAYFSCFVESSLYAQTNNVDSLFEDYVKTKDPSDKFYKGYKIINDLSFNGQHHKTGQIIECMKRTVLRNQDQRLRQGLIFMAEALVLNARDSMDGAFMYAKKALPLLKQDPYYFAEAQSFMTMHYFNIAQYDTCIAYGTKVLNEVIKSKNRICETQIQASMGGSYYFTGNRKMAVEFTLKAIETARQNHYKNMLVQYYISLSNIYNREDDGRSKYYAMLALKEIGRNNRSILLSGCYLTVGNVYLSKGNPDSAAYYYELCKVEAERQNDRRIRMLAIGNLANVAYELKDYEKALMYSFQTLPECKKIQPYDDIAAVYGSIADIYRDKKDFAKALKYYDSALVITKQINSADDYIYNYQGLSKTYEMMGDYKHALDFYKLYRDRNDSLNNNQSSKNILQIELEFKYKAEQREKDLVQAGQNLLTAAKIKQQQYMIWACVLGALLLLVFSGFMIKSNVVRRKINRQLQQFNKEIVQQKNIIEDKNQEITDSIMYASRIQQGIIPGEDELKLILPDHFVFFRPRNIVSGDFYWANKMHPAPGKHTERVLLAVADCTGHGVPGAFMSLVGYTLLNQTLHQSHIVTPAQALDEINQQLPKTIKSKSSTGAIKDGMEVAMCLFDFEALTLEFAGANSNIYIVRNGSLLLFKGDKQPIGECVSGTVNTYTNQYIPLQKNDSVYLITDGYPDQFGGEKGKKFKYRPLENLFCTIGDKSASEQGSVLAKTFDDWKADHEQVDDVLVVGIKL